MTDTDQRKVFAGSMVELCRDPKFQVFVENVRGMKDQAVRDLVSDDIIANPSKAAAAQGSVRTYLDILDVYDDFLRQPLQNAIDSGSE